LHEFLNRFSSLALVLPGLVAGLRLCITRRVFNLSRANLQHPDPKKMRFPYENAVFSSSIRSASED
jgi:hypothetical protein